VFCASTGTSTVTLVGTSATICASTGTGTVTFTGTIIFTGTAAAPTTQLPLVPQRPDSLSSLPPLDLARLSSLPPQKFGTPAVPSGTVTCVSTGTITPVSTFDGTCASTGTGDSFVFQLHPPLR
jgi:hypothetical protein